MKIGEKDFVIKTRTTGFSSPAESYVDKRLDLNDLIVNDLKTTFYLKYNGVDALGVKKGSVLVVDKSVSPSEGDLVVIMDTSCFKIRKYSGQKNLWGKITWILNKI